jgi:hypothetical protein
LARACSNLRKNKSFLKSKTKITIEQYLAVLQQSYEMFKAITVKKNGLKNRPICAV